MRDGQAIVKWTRSRGFEMCSPLAHAESVQHLLAIVGDSLDHPTFRLQQLEYRDKQMFLIKEQRLLQPDTWNGLQGPIEHWIESKITWGNRRRDVFHEMPRGRYWEVVVDGRPQFIQDVLIRTTVASPFRIKLSHQLALLLYVYGPLSPATAARGLDVSEQQVKGAAAAIARKELIVKGKEPYTPMEMFEVSRSGDSGALRDGDTRLANWLEDEFGDRMPAWVRGILRTPETVKQRAMELKRRKG